MLRVGCGRRDRGSIIDLIDTLSVEGDGDVCISSRFLGYLLWFPALGASNGRETWALGGQFHPVKHCQDLSMSMHLLKNLHAAR
jgi:hypothetical protein